MKWLKRWCSRLFQGERPAELHILHKENTRLTLDLSDAVDQMLEYWAWELIIKEPANFPQINEEERVRKAKAVVLLKATLLFNAAATEVRQGRRVGSSKLLSDLHLEFDGII